MLGDLIKKIELQSVLVLFITLLFGCTLLHENNSLTTPAGILGSVSIAFGILYTFGSFFSNQIKESYKDVIAEYKASIANLRSNQKFLENNYRKTISSQDEKQTGEWQIRRESEMGTKEG